MPSGPFFYKLEFIFDDTAPSDASVFIQMRDNPPIYQEHVTKESYDILPSLSKHVFLTNLFLIAGVTELSTKAYRVWIMKSPVYSWSEVLVPVLFYMSGFFGYSGIKDLPGSGNLDGTGLTLNASTNRRKI